MRADRRPSAHRRGLSRSDHAETVLGRPEHAGTCVARADVPSGRPLGIDLPLTRMRAQPAGTTRPSTTPRRHGRPPGDTAGARWVRRPAGTTVTGQAACSTHATASEPSAALAIAGRPRWPSTSSSAPSDRFTRTDRGLPATAATSTRTWHLGPPVRTSARTPPRWRGRRSPPNAGGPVRQGHPVRVRPGPGGSTTTGGGSPARPSWRSALAVPAALVEHQPVSRRPGEGGCVSRAR